MTLRTTTSVAAAIIVLSGLSAYAQSAAPSSSPDQKFITKAAYAGMAEVAEAKLALDKSSNDDIKKFAQQMVVDHGKANDQLKAIATSEGATVPSDLNSSDQKQVDKLSAMSGDKFDKAYLSDQKSAHKDAVSLFTKESKSGKDDKLKDFASQTLPTLEGHKTMVDGMVKSMKS